jgi:hypothetical protein
MCVCVCVCENVPQAVYRCVRDWGQGNDKLAMALRHHTRLGPLCCPGDLLGPCVTEECRPTTLDKVVLISDVTACLANAGDWHNM